VSKRGYKDATCHFLPQECLVIGTEVHVIGYINVGIPSFAIQQIDHVTLNDKT
jgi:hypothetical protein